MSHREFNSQRFRNLRRHYKIRQWDLTRATGIPQSKISLIENDFVRATEFDGQRLQKGLETLIKKNGE